MSSPIQPSPDIRRPPSSSSLSQAPLTSSGPASSPFPQQLPPPSLTPGTPVRPPSTATARPLQPPGLGDISYQSPAISSPGPIASTGPPYPAGSQQSTQSVPGLSSAASMPAPPHAQRTSAITNPKTSLPPISQRGPSIAPPSSFAEGGPVNVSRVQNKSPPPPPRSPAVQNASPATRPPSGPTQPASTTNNASGTGSSTVGYRPLNVRDALTYLDQVKVQFSAQPDVYNRFLDIMKDFKSQAIDTPGVIDRVSVLFNGHPELISGFNTFLPPGYRIECSSDPNEPDVIRVTTPTGTTLTRTSRPVVGSGARMGSSLGLRDQETNTMLHGGSSGTGPLPPPPQQPASTYYQSPYAHMPPPPPSSLPPPPMQTPMSSHSMHPPPHGSYMSGPGPAAARRPPSLVAHEPPDGSQSHINGSSGTRRAPVEFNHAINYVNKIKNRFANDPDTYKQFLEILQTYQKERKPIQEVYAHVQYLFNGAPDLLHEFKQFLPEIAGQGTSEYMDDTESPYLGGGQKRAIYQTSPQSGPFLPPGKKKRAATKRTKTQKGGMDEDMISGYPASSYFDPMRPSISAEEVELFESIRKHIGNKPSYEEFLKTLNLYTQQIIDADILMKQVEGFIGSDRELFEWFKSVVAIDLKDQVIERPVPTIPKPDLNHCKTVESSPSYRLVSKEWQNQPCSGRDQLCWEVLNDEYVSHPIWASEDSGFVASKKNQYEEAMHRCEEERYDYDLNIDANLNAIALLEPIAKRLEQMTPEEKANFRLEPGLGGQSVTIYERIIKKVYEEERGKEIIEMLYNNPARVVPILLKRLIQKDQEWRKAQHEWNKVWREMDAKNFYRALDYQGLTFKSNDRKAMAVKSLVAEIETLHEESRAQEGGKGSNKNTQYPLLFSFDDPEIFKDITRIIFSYIEKQNGFSSNDRAKIRTFVRIFIPLFFHVDDVVPEGLNVESDEGDEHSMDEEDESHSVNTDYSEAELGRSPRDRSRSPSAGVRRRNGRHRADEADGSADLLRDVLTKNSKQTTGDDNDTVNSYETGTKSPLASRDLSETPVPEDNDDADVEENDNMDVDMDVDVTNDSGDPYANGDEERSIKKEDISGDEQTKFTSDMDADNGATIDSNHNTDRSRSPSNAAESDGQEGNRLFAAAAAATAPGMHKRTVYSFFCNTAFYCFFRLYQLVYERLLKMKQLDAAMRADPKYKGKKSNKVARELGLYSNRFDDIDLSKGYYQALLDLIDRFFDGELDQTMFEEKTRYIFVTEAHVLFTIDKLIHSVIKQIQVVTLDEKSVELVELFRSDQNLDSTCPRIQSVYRLRVEETMGSEENLYKINFDTETHRMSIQLLDKDDDMLEPTPQDHYENYVASYMDWGSETAGIDRSKMKPTFLTRNWKPHNRHLNKIYVRSRLQYKISQDSYHMYYIIGSEDVFIRPPLSKAPTNQDGSSKWRSWLESPSTGWSSDINSEEKRNTMEAIARKLLAGEEN